MASKDDGIMIAAAKSSGGIAEFIRTTREEIRKVTWPSRQETLVTTAMVIALAVAAGIFFLIVDSALGYIVSRFLGMSS